MSVEPKSNNTEERRQYFRIDDQVNLEFQVLQGEEDYQRVVQQLDQSQVNAFTAAAVFTGNSKEMNLLLRNAGYQSPQLTRYLKALDDKLNSLAQLFLVSNWDQQAHHTHPVNLSAGGVAFIWESPLELGTLLELRLLLRPEHVGILSVSKVVNCQPSSAPDSSGYQISLEYVHLREVDRDLIVKHVLDRQTVQRRQQYHTD